MVLEGRNINSAGQSPAHSGDLYCTCLECFPKESTENGFIRERCGTMGMHSRSLSLDTVLSGLALDLHLAGSEGAFLWDPYG